MIGRPDFNEPMIGQSVYVVMKNGQPVGVTLTYPAVVRAFGRDAIDDFMEVPWLG